MILLPVVTKPHMKWTVPQYGRTEGTVRVTENGTVNVTKIYGRWQCRSSKNYCKDIVDSVDSFMLLCFFVNLRCCMTSFMDSLFMRTPIGGMDLRRRDRAAGATHVQISWIFAWIPSEVTWTFFFDLPIWDSNSSSFSCRSFSSQREPTVVGSITAINVIKISNKISIIILGE